MSEALEHALPEFREWGQAAVRLLQGVVYSDDSAAWDILLANQSELSDYFIRIGLVLVVDEPDGLAYLRQLQDDEQAPGYDSLPRLFRRSQLSYEATLLCVLLREELRRFEEEDLDNERCVVEFDVLFDAWKSFFPANEDEVRMRKVLSVAMRKLTDLKFVRRFGTSDGAWEVRRILKARVPLDELENLRQRLAEAAQDPAANEATTAAHGEDQEE